MLKIAIAAQKDLSKQQQKTNKTTANQQTPVEILQEAIQTMKEEANKLDIEIITDEGTYTAVATDKVARKLKTGVDEKTANAHQSQISIAMSKRDSKIESIDSKIESIETEKTALQEETERKIEALKAKMEYQCSVLDSKVKKLQTDIEITRTTSESTINYFQPLLNRCYEAVPIITVYPPSHFKKQETLKQLKSSIATAEHNILLMKASSYNDLVVDTNTEELKKRKSIARQEANEQLVKAEEVQYREECRMAQLKKDVYRAEEKARKDRQLEREEELLNMSDDEPLVYPPPSKYRK